MTIKSVREEIKKGCGHYYGTSGGNGNKYYCGKTAKTRKGLCHHCNSKLEGFNLGVSLAQKEFKSWIDELRNEIAKDGVARLTGDNSLLEGREPLAWSDAFDFFSNKFKKSLSEDKI